MHTPNFLQTQRGLQEPPLAAGHVPVRQPGDRLCSWDRGAVTAFDRGGAGKPLVLIHGFSGTRLIWEPVLEALERSHDVLAVNLAGHVGGPEMADTPVSVNALVDAVERDLDAAGFDTADVVGNSLGGWIAFELATRGRARSVVALAPAGGWEQGSRAERRLRMLFTRNHKFATALLPRIDSLTRRPRLRRALTVAARRPRRADLPGCGSPDGPRLGRLPRVLRADGRDPSRRAAARV